MKKLVAQKTHPGKDEEQNLVNKSFKREYGVCIGASVKVL